MNELTILMTLASVHLIALMSPGPDFALVVQSVSRFGRRTGIAIATGLSTGILLHALFSMTGISYLIHASPNLYLAVQLIGGSYLIFLGALALKSVGLHRKQSKVAASPLPNASDNLDRKHSSAFIKGITTNLLNPKALVFFVSLMSSLVPTDMSTTGKGVAVVLLFALSMMWFSLLAWLLSSSALQKRLSKLTIYIDGCCGVLFTVIGVSIWMSVLQ